MQAAPVATLQGKWGLQLAGLQDAGGRQGTEDAHLEVVADAQL